MCLYLYLYYCVCCDNRELANKDMQLTEMTDNLEAESCFSVRMHCCLLVCYTSSILLLYSCVGIYSCRICLLHCLAGYCERHLRQNFASLF